MNESILEDFQRQLPPFLTVASKEAILKGLQDFPEKFDPYLKSVNDDSVEQGDVFSDVPLYFYEADQKKATLAIVLSNACDIAPENKRNFPVSAVVAQMLRLDRYLDRLRSASVQESAIRSIEKSIRSQHITNIFFLPQGASLDGDYIVLFDHLTSIPLSTFLQQKGKRLARFSLIGYYLFLFKLSVHFCRFPERS